MLKNSKEKIQKQAYYRTTHILQTHSYTNVNSFPPLYVHSFNKQRTGFFLSAAVALLKIISDFVSSLVILGHSKL